MGSHLAELPLILIEMRARLVHKQGLSEAQAAACVEAFAAVARAVEPDELASAVRELRRAEKIERDARIRAQLRTGNAAKLAKAEGLSVSRIYEIAGVRPGRPAAGGPAGDGERTA
jgi:hypothetical protein